MNKNPTGTSMKAPIATYIIISAIGFLLSVFCVYYYIHFIQGNVSEEVSQEVFYLILILFGISASAMIFGVMNSVGVLKGERSGTKYYLTGPAVGVVLVVLGGFYLPRSTVKRILSVRVMNERHFPVTSGKVTIFLSQYTREQVIDNNGLAVFSDINVDDLTGKIKFDITSEGYSRMVFDTLLRNPAPIQIILSERKVIHISGKVTDANEMPISDVVIMVDGTQFFAKTITNGSYSFNITNYSIGDAIDLVSSNKGYKDKTRNLKIERQDMENIDFVLQPLKP